MNYKELNDNELIYLCSENNEDAASLLIEKLYIKYFKRVFKRI